MKNISDVLSQKEAEYNNTVHEYRRLGEKVNQLGREIEAMRLTLKLIADAQDQTAEEQNRKLSQPQMVRAVLVERNAEMHLSEIVKEVEHKFGRVLEASVLGATLFRYAKRGSVFYKSPKKPNTWGLLEWSREAKSVSELIPAVQ